MSKRLLVALAATATAMASPSFAQLTCQQVFQNETRAESQFDQKAFQNISSNEGSFTRHRGINSYHSALGEAFAKALEQGQQSGSDFHWLDAGGGEGNAINQYLNSVPNNSHLQATLLAYDTPAVAHDRMAVLKGRFIENIPQNELPRADLITDVFGPIAYSSRPDLVLTKYLQALKPNGKIILSLGSGHGVFGQHNKVSLPDGRLVSFKDWILSLEGLNMNLRELIVPSEFTKGQIISLEITLKNGQVPEIPALELLNIKNGMPPEMIFRELDNSSSAQTKATVLQDALNAKYSQKTANQFFDAFRAGFWTGSWTHALLGSIKKLNTNDSWLLLSPNAENLKKEITSDQFSLKDSSFTGMGQAFTAWRSQGIFKKLKGQIETPRLENFPRQANTRLITDYAGPLQASSRPDLVLKTYLESLSANGELYIFLGDGKAGYGEQTHVLNTNNQKFYFLQWISKIPGISVQSFRDPYGQTGVSFVKIKIANKNKISIPELEFLGTSDLNGDGIPSPLFRETGHKLQIN